MQVVQDPARRPQGRVNGNIKINPFSGRNGTNDNANGFEVTAQLAQQIINAFTIHVQTLSGWYVSEITF